MDLLSLKNTLKNIADAFKQRIPEIKNIKFTEFPSNFIKDSFNSELAYSGINSPTVVCDSSFSSVYDSPNLYNYFSGINDNSYYSSIIIDANKVSNMDYAFSNVHDDIKLPKFINESDASQISMNHIFSDCYFYVSHRKTLESSRGINSFPEYLKFIENAKSIDWAFAITNLKDKHSHVEYKYNQYGESRWWLDSDTDIHFKCNSAVGLFYGLKFNNADTYYKEYYESNDDFYDYDLNIKTANTINLYFNNITNLSCAFANSRLYNIFEIINTENVIDGSFAFSNSGMWHIVKTTYHLIRYQDYSKTSNNYFMLPRINFNFPNLQNGAHMFENCKYFSYFTPEQFNFSNLQNGSFMFNSSAPLLHFKNFNLNNLQDGSWMFRNTCINILKDSSYQFVNTSNNLQNCKGMFASSTINIMDPEEITTIENDIKITPENICEFDFEKCDDASQLFYSTNITFYDGGSSSYDSEVYPTISLKNTQFIKNSAEMFYNLQKLFIYTENNELNFCNSENVKNMFSKNLLFNCNIERINISNALDISYLFNNFNTEYLNGIIIDANNAENASCFLYGQTTFNEPFTLILNNLKYAYCMFGNCHNFNQPLSFNLNKLENGPSMFYNCYNFNQPLNLESLKQGDYMFYDCYNFNQPLNLESLEYGNCMFSSCYNFNQPLNLENLKYSDEMFRGCHNFNQPLNLKSLEYGNRMFFGLQSFNKPLNNLENLKYGYDMFCECHNFNQPLNLESLEYGNYMFYNCYNFNQPISCLNLKNLQSAKCMFENSSINIDYIDISNISGTKFMFSGCYVNNINSIQCNNEHKYFDSIFNAKTNCIGLNNYIENFINNGGENIFLSEFDQDLNFSQDTINMNIEFLSNFYKNITIDSKNLKGKITTSNFYGKASINCQNYSAEIEAFRGCNFFGDLRVENVSSSFFENIGKFYPYNDYYSSGRYLATKYYYTDSSKNNRFSEFSCNAKVNNLELINFNYYYGMYGSYYNSHINLYVENLNVICDEFKPFHFFVNNKHIEYTDSGVPVEKSVYSDPSSDSSFLRNIKIKAKTGVFTFVNYCEGHYSLDIESNGGYTNRIFDNYYSHPAASYPFKFVNLVGNINVKNMYGSCGEDFSIVSFNGVNNLKYIFEPSGHYRPLITTIKNVDSMPMYFESKVVTDKDDGKIIYDIENIEFSNIGESIANFYNQVRINHKARANNFILKDVDNAENFLNNSNCFIIKNNVYIDNVKYLSNLSLLEDNPLNVYLNIENVISANSLFNGFAKSNILISGNANSLQYADSMFRNSNFNQNIDLNDIICANYMFANCPNFNQPTIIVNNVDKAFYMFENCYNLQPSIVNISNVNNAALMFFNMGDLNQTQISISNVKNTDRMFDGERHGSIFESVSINLDKISSSSYIFNYADFYNSTIDISNYYSQNIFNYCRIINSTINVYNTKMAELNFRGYSDDGISKIHINDSNIRKISIGISYPSIYIDNAIDGKMLDCNMHGNIIFSNSIIGINNIEIYSSPYCKSAITFGKNVEYAHNIHCNGNIDIDLSLCSNLTDISNMFKGSYSDFNSFVEIPENVENTAYMFTGCTSFNQEIEIPESVTNVAGMFNDCESFNQRVVTHEGLKDMSHLFSYCKNFNQEIIIPSGVENISGIFEHCTEYNSNIYVPLSVKYYDNIINNCPNFSAGIYFENEEISVADFVKGTSYNGFGITTKLINEDCSYYFQDLYGFNQSVEITDSVVNIQGLFENCYGFNQSTEISSSVTDASKMFVNCYNFNQQVEIPSSVLNAQRLLENCYNFDKTITIQNGVTDISRMFYGCASFNQPIAIPDSVTEYSQLLDGCVKFNSPIECNTDKINVRSLVIGTGYNAENFNNIIAIPPTVTDGSYWYQKLYGFNQDVDIPASVESFYYMFDNCRNFSSNITLHRNNLPRWEYLVEDIKGINVLTLNYDGDVNQLDIYKFSQYKKINTFVIDSTGSVNQLNLGSYGSVAPIGNIIIGDNVKDISNLTNSSYYCNWNGNITIGDSVECCNNMLRNFSNFNQPIILPSTVTPENIDNMLAYCNNWDSTITYKDGTEVDLTRAVRGTKYSGKLNNILPDQEDISYWFRDYYGFNQPVLIPSENVKYVNGLFYNCYNFDQEIEIPENILNCSYMFYNCRNWSIQKDLIIPDSAVNINSMFINCYNFNANVTIGNGVKSAYNLFNNLAKFDKNIIIGDNVENTAFMLYNCLNFNKPINLPNKVNNASYMLYNCQNFNSPITIDNESINTVNMLYSCKSFNSTIKYLNGEDLQTSKLFDIVRNSGYNGSGLAIPEGTTNASYWFTNLWNFNQDVEVPESVTNYENILYHCYNWNANITFLNGFIPELNFYKNTGYNGSLFAETFKTIDIDGKSYINGSNVYQCQYLNYFYGFNQPIVFTYNPKLDRYSSYCIGNGFNSDIIIDNTNVSFSKANQHINSVTLKNITSMELSWLYFSTEKLIIDSTVTNLYGYSLRINVNSPVRIPNSLVQHNLDTVFSLEFNQPLIFEDGKGNIKNLCEYYDSHCKYSYFNSPITFEKNELIGDDFIGLVRNTGYNQPGFNEMFIFNEDIDYKFAYLMGFNQPITIPDNIINAKGAFYECRNFNQPIENLDNVKDTSYMFYNCYSFNQDIILNAENYYYTFYSASAKSITIMPKNYLCQDNSNIYYIFENTNCPDVYICPTNGLCIDHWKSQNIGNYHLPKSYPEEYREDINNIFNYRVVYDWDIDISEMTYSMVYNSGDNGCS